MTKREAILDVTEENVRKIAALEKAAHAHRSTGEKIADGVAAIVGSWTFIILQSCVLFAWMLINVGTVVFHWDPYPFTLLNLVLSFQAAYASPIIMMSQNRQSRLSERRNHLDLQINLLSEQENTEMLKMLKGICAKLEIPIETSRSSEFLDQQMNPEELITQIEKTEELACGVDPKQKE